MEVFLLVLTVCPCVYDEDSLSQTGRDEPCSKLKRAEGKLGLHYLFLVSLGANFPGVYFSFWISPRLQVLIGRRKCKPVPIRFAHAATLQMFCPPRMSRAHLSEQPEPLCSRLGLQKGSPHPGTREQQHQPPSLLSSQPELWQLLKIQSPERLTTNSP